MEFRKKKYVWFIDPGNIDRIKCFRFSTERYGICISGKTLHGLGFVFGVLCFSLNQPFSRSWKELCFRSTVITSDSMQKDFLRSTISLCSTLQMKLSHIWSSLFNCHPKYRQILIKRAALNSFVTTKFLCISIKYSSSQYTMHNKNCHQWLSEYVYLDDTS